MPSVSSAPASLLPRLLYVASSPSQGGIEQHSLALASQFRTRSYSIQFACRPGSFVEDQCRTRGIPHLPLHVRNSGDLSAAIRLARLIAGNKIDVVHIHSRRDYVIGVLGVKLARRKYPSQLLLHAHMIRPLGEPAGLNGRFFARNTAGVIAVSNAVRDYLCAVHHFSPSFVSLIYNGVELEDFALPQTPRARQWRSAQRQEWAIPADALVIGMVGRLDAKGQAALLAAAPDLIKTVPSLRIVLIGAEGLPGEKLRLQALADATGIGSRILFTGQRDDIPAALAAFDLLVHLPMDESFGLALAEAMASGLPTVATNIGGCREVVSDGVSGLLVSPGDPDALRDALLCLLNPATGTARRTQMGLAGYEVAAANFSQERQVNDLSALYRQVCAHAV